MYQILHGKFKRLFKSKGKLKMKHSFFTFYQQFLL